MANSRDNLAPQSRDDDFHEAVSGREGNSPRKFVVLCLPRTGSTMLTDRLGTHGDVRCLSAIFSEAGWPAPGTAGQSSPINGWIRKSLDPKWNDLEYRLSRPAKLLRDILAKSADKLAVGFKHHFFANEVTDYLLNSNVRKIILTRKNILAAYSSHKITKATESAERSSRGPAVRISVEFDPEEFGRFRAKRERLYLDVCKRVGRRFMEIDYTEARKPEGLESIGRFLAVDPAGFGPPQTVKRNPDDIASRFVNRDLVLSCLQEIGLEHWASEN